MKVERRSLRMIDTRQNVARPCTDDVDKDDGKMVRDDETEDGERINNKTESDYKMRRNRME